MEVCNVSKYIEQAPGNSPIYGCAVIFSRQQMTWLNITIRLKLLHNYLVVGKALMRKVGCIFIFVFPLRIPILTKGLWNHGQLNRYGLISFHFVKMEGHLSNEISKTLPCILEKARMYHALNKWASKYFVCYYWL